jgi:hypothetical protein
MDDLAAEPPLAAEAFGGLLRDVVRQRTATVTGTSLRRLLFLTEASLWMASGLSRASIADTG